MSAQSSNPSVDDLSPDQRADLLDLAEGTQPRIGVAIELREAGMVRGIGQADDDAIAITWELTEAGRAAVEEMAAERPPLELTPGARVRHVDPDQAYLGAGTVVTDPTTGTHHMDAGGQWVYVRWDDGAADWMPPEVLRADDGQETPLPDLTDADRRALLAIADGASLPLRMPDTTAAIDNLIVWHVGRGGWELTEAGEYTVQRLRQALVEAAPAPTPLARATAVLAALAAELGEHPAVTATIDLGEHPQILLGQRLHTTTPTQRAALIADLTRVTGVPVHHWVPGIATVTAPDWRGSGIRVWAQVDEGDVPQTGVGEPTIQQAQAMGAEALAPLLAAHPTAPTATWRLSEIRPGTIEGHIFAATASDDDRRAAVQAWAEILGAQMVRDSLMECYTATGTWEGVTVTVWTSAGEVATGE